MHVLVQVEGGDHDDGDRVRDVASGEELGHLDAVEPGHPDVDQAHVGAEPVRQLDGGPAVGGLADDLDAWLGVEDHRQAGAHQILVIGHQHAHRHRGSSVGSSASTALGWSAIVLGAAGVVAATLAAANGPSLLVAVSILGALVFQLAVGVRCIRLSRD